MPDVIEPDKDAPPVRTLTTGVLNLDQLLGGGLPRGSLLLIVGPPGSGKTTMANQIAFAAARAGQRAIVFAALSEPSSKLVAHLSSFTFYDPALVGERIQFLSLEQFLTGSLSKTREALVASVRQAQASVVVLDGFRGIRAAEVNPQAARQFLYTVGSTLSVTGTTTIITSEADPHDPVFFPEATTADVILGLHAQVRGLRQQRRIEVIKLRLAAPLPGLHGLVISEEGLVVTPRLESRVNLHEHMPRPEPLTPAIWERARASAAPAAGRASFGLLELDVALGGGITRGTSTLLMGHLSTGKTFLGLHFALAGAKQGEPAVFLSFRETYEQLALKMLPFTLGQELERALAPGGGVTLVRWPPVELHADVVAEHLLTTVDQLGAQRLVVDSITELERAARESSDPTRVENYLAALVETLRRRHLTTLFIREVAQNSKLTLDIAEEPVAVLAENILLLRQVEQQGQLRRALSVAKMRFSAYDPTTLQEFRIAAPEGISILGPLGAEHDVPKPEEADQ